MGWVKNLITSTLTFNITQFFLLLNYCLLIFIMKKAGFDNHIISFFSNYLVDRKTNYFWNNFISPIFNVNVGVGQGSALSPILLALYLSPFIYILENHLKNLKIPIFIISFVDDGLFISQNKSINISNSHLFYSYNILTKLLEKFSLIVEHSKTEIFYFNRSQGVFNPPPLELTPLGRSILWPNDLWKYLGFIFNRKLTFHQHVNFYTNKLISTVKCMKLLSNSNCGINPPQKCLLYRTCVLSIVLYGFQLWFYNHAPMMYHLKALGKIQRRVAIWILGAFKTSPSYSIKAITGLIPIKLHFQKLGGRLQLWAYKLLPNYLIRSLINPQNSVPTSQNFIYLDSLTNRQHSLIKSYLVNIANKFNESFLFFIPLHSEFSPGLRIIDNFSDHISFNIHNKEKDDKHCAHQLDELALESSSSSSTTIIASDTSIKNDVATSILHTYTYNRPIIKMIHQAVHITSTEAELFAIRCGINQALNLDNMSKVIVITNSIHVARKIFELFVHPYQVQSAAILSDLCKFFMCHKNNSIEFWEYPSCLKWHLHNGINKETKTFNPIPLFLCKISWDFSKKSKSNTILKVWKIMFQASNLKGN